MNSMDGTTQTFPYVSSMGTTFQVSLTLATDAESGLFYGMGQTHEGAPNNSAYVGNAVTIPPFASGSLQAAFEQALQVVASELDQGRLATPGVLGVLTPEEVVGDKYVKQPVR